MASEPKQDPPETFSDLPPESFWVARDDEQDWFDRNAVMQRKTSLKIGLNRNFNSFHHHHHHHRSPSSDVHHSNRKSARISVFALPNKTHKSSGPDGGGPLEKKPGRTTLLFRSRSEPGGKSMGQVPEPGSPRVSCTGRVKFKSGDGKKTGLSRILSSFFGAGSGKSGSRTRGNAIIR